MNINTRSAAHDWDREISRDELLGRLASLKDQVAQVTPILDDDDVEAAIDEAAERIVSDR